MTFASKPFLHGPTLFANLKRRVLHVVDGRLYGEVGRGLDLKHLVLSSHSALPDGRAHFGEALADVREGNGKRVVASRNLSGMESVVQNIYRYQFWLLFGRITYFMALGGSSWIDCTFSPPQRPMSRIALRLGRCKRLEKEILKLCVLYRQAE